MTYFETYRSNTLAGSGNQLPCLLSGDEPSTVRLFYRVTEGGERDYSLLFSNINDSTFDDGSEGYCNHVYGPWTIRSLKLGVCSRDCFAEGFDLAMPRTFFDEEKIEELHTVTFNGEAAKTVAPGEIFSTDPLILAPEKGGYLCVEMTFHGKEVPAYAEFLAPIYRKREDNTWEIYRRVPTPAMIGATLDKKPRIAFLGDSITCGCGTEPNAYAHWCALVAEALGDAYSYHNLGLGFARAQDMASGGAWFYKASQHDVAVVCFGVNDILQGRKADDIMQDLRTIVRRLKKAGLRVLLQTVPPFDYEGEALTNWKLVNQFIFNELSSEADAVFNNLPFLSASEDAPQMARYDGHPNHEGSRIWAEALFPVMKTFLEESPVSIN